MADISGARGLIAVDKIGCEILFLDPVPDETQVAIDGFPRTVLKLLVLPEAGLAMYQTWATGFMGATQIAPNGSWLYTENAEDATVSVIDLKTRKLATPRRHRNLARWPYRGRGGLYQACAVSDRYRERESRPRSTARRRA